MATQRVLKNRKLGKAAPRLDKRTLKLARYLTPMLPTPPDEAGYTERVSQWPMYLNDSLGDCVIAAAGHMIQQWTAYAGAMQEISDDAILEGYKAVGGYNPDDPTTDQGCDMLTALNYWRQNGFGGHKIAAFVQINPKSQLEIMQAVYLFGNLYGGFALPLTAQNPGIGPDGFPSWEITQAGLEGDGSYGSWGGHCVPIVGYSNRKSIPGTQVVTWGTIYDVTWTFIYAYADELWAVVSPDWFDINGRSPTGFNIDQLKTDLMLVTNHP